MGMQSLLLACALCTAFVCGTGLAVAVRSVVRNRRRQRMLHESAQAGMSARATTVSEGLAGKIIAECERQTWAAADEGGWGLAYKALNSRSYERLIELAGLSGIVSAEGLVRTRVILICMGTAAGSVAALPLSSEAVAIGALMGAGAGSYAVAWALKSEAKMRQNLLERHLSEAVEVVCLGLRGGLSFDRSLELYCACFDGVLSVELASAAQVWNAGLRTREEALRSVAQGYDSPMLGRVVDSVIRSMRFGSPLADSLEVLAAEARQVHRARVEEEVMKAPVKMMVPVGTLILPSMMLLVMGPILLDVMQGF